MTNHGLMPLWFILTFAGGVVACLIVQRLHRFIDGLAGDVTSALIETSKRVNDKKRRRK